jgi:hypothetical protein
VLSVDVIIPVRSGANPELRYALRSLANLPHDRVVIIGDPPDWVTNVDILPGNRSENPHYNVADNIRLGCLADGLSDEVILLNDDFYITAPVDEIPSLYRSTLNEHISTLAHRKDWWPRSLRLTQTYLATRVEVPLSFELHIPMVVRRAAMRDVCERAIAESPDNPLQTRSLYGNLFHVPATRADGDVKLYNHAVVELPSPFTSTHDGTFTSFRRQLDALFPAPSRYER